MGRGIAVALTQRKTTELGIGVQYCQGYMRQQQGQYYSLSPQDVKDMPERLASLCGFAYKGIMGHVGGQPAVLGAAQSDEVAYAAMRTKTGCRKLSSPFFHLGSRHGN